MSLVLIKSFSFGFAVAIAVGPIALIIVNNGLNHGFAVAAKSGLGAALADLTFAIVSFTIGIQISAILKGHQDILKIAASIILILLGLWFLKNSLAQLKTTKTIEANTPKVCGLKTTYTLTLLNPLTIIMFSAFATQVNMLNHFMSIVPAAFSLFLGSLVVQISLATLGSVLKTFLIHHKWKIALNGLSALGIIAFGLLGLF
ncbi:MAG: hypothetical protein COV45_00065 [Deltaproteobacteria bacterium CG11_big_fil_rev_8_21_14_0_20_47_16]|nr:MAG: hypothetical protein COV45_00065 [Deltaproteobacteria bacterium CG11_big_fil_rev_8_21_14_0_20_47_16]